MAVSGAELAEGLLTRTESLVPLLRANALATEREGRVAAENIAALERAGVFKMTAPRQAGGYELPVLTQVEVLAAIARGCGSTSWATAVTASASGWPATSPIELQDEVFAQEDVRVTLVGAPTGRLTASAPAATASTAVGPSTPAVSTGTGLSPARSARAETAGGGDDDPVLAIVPYGQLQIGDDWT